MIPLFEERIQIVLHSLCFLRFTNGASKAVNDAQLHVRIRQAILIHAQDVSKIGASLFTRLNMTARATSHRP